MAKDYVSIRVSTLRGDQKIDFDAYLKIDEKWILYLRQGDSFEGTRLERLKTKKLKKMYISTEDEGRYRNYMQKNIEMAYDDKSGKDIKTRSEIIQGAQQNNAEEVFERPENAEAYVAAKDASAKYVDFLVKNNDAVKSIVSLPNLDQSIAHHGVTVSTLAVALAEQLKLFDAKQRQLLALGGLLHDFGHYDTPIKIARPMRDFSKEDLEIYKKHPVEGAQKVKDKNHMDLAVTTIIHQHEEKCDASGPLGYSEQQIDPMALVTSAANTVDRLMTYEGLGREQVVKHLMVQEMGKYPLQYIQTLGNILKSI
ncbi:MAG: HD domain-containing protein [Pseudobdellovibrio sp.]|nr:HD domain-containing protein [Pseudobdellovibrio sp.]